MEVKQSPTFRAWLSGLKDRTAVVAIVSRLTRLGQGLPGDVEPVGEGVSELRVHHGPGYRVYFKKRRKTLIVILCGGAKSRQTKDIKEALKLARQLKDEDDNDDED